MRILKAIAAVLLLTAGVANAQVSATVTAVSDYDFRGQTQTAGDPALQGSIDYAHGSGWYIGAWASNIDFGNCCGENMELDLYTGFAGAAENGIGWDVGLIDYTYPGTDVDVDFFEVYASISYKMFKGKFWYADDFFNSGESAYYIEGNATVPLPNDFSLLIHAGYSDGDFWSSDSYFDYAVGASRPFGHFNLALKWIDGSDYEPGNNTPGDVFSTDARVVISLSTTVPWSTD